MRLLPDEISSHGIGIAIHLVRQPKWTADHSIVVVADGKSSDGQGEQDRNQHASDIPPPGALVTNHHDHHRNAHRQAKHETLKGTASVQYNGTYRHEQ